MDSGFRRNDGVNTAPMAEFRRIRYPGGHIRHTENNLTRHPGESRGPSYGYTFRKTRRKRNSVLLIS